LAQVVLPNPGYISSLARGWTPCNFTSEGGNVQTANVCPVGVTVDASGNIYVAGDARILKITASTGTINSVAGNGTQGYSGEGGAATSAKIYPYGLALDASGNIYIADGYNYRI